MSSSAQNPSPDFDADLEALQHVVDRKESEIETAKLRVELCSKSKELSSSEARYTAMVTKFTSACESNLDLARECLSLKDQVSQLQLEVQASQRDKSAAEADALDKVSQQESVLQESAAKELTAQTLLIEVQKERQRAEEEKDLARKLRKMALEDKSLAQQERRLAYQERMSAEQERELARQDKESAQAERESAHEEREEAMEDRLFAFQERRHAKQEAKLMNDIAQKVADYSIHRQGLMVTEMKEVLSNSLRAFSRATTLLQRQRAASKEDRDTIEVSTQRSGGELPTGSPLRFASHESSESLWRPAKRASEEALDTNRPLSNARVSSYDPIGLTMNLGPDNIESDSAQVTGIPSPQKTQNMSEMPDVTPEPQNPLDLLWSSIDFPDDWTLTDTAKLRSIMEENPRRLDMPGHFELIAQNHLQRSRKQRCLYNEITGSKTHWIDDQGNVIVNPSDDDMDRKCEACTLNSRPCVALAFAHAFAPSGSTSKYVFLKRAN